MKWNQNSFVPYFILLLNPYYRVCRVQSCVARNFRLGTSRGTRENIRSSLSPSLSPPLQIFFIPIRRGGKWRRRYSRRKSRRRGSWMLKREQKPQQGFGYNIFATAEPRYYNRNAYRFLRRMRASLVNVHPAYERTEVTRGGNKGRKKNRPKRGGGVGGRNLSAIADISLVREPDVKWGIIPGVEVRRGGGCVTVQTRKRAKIPVPRIEPFFPRTGNEWLRLIRERIFSSYKTRYYFLATFF